MIHGLRETLDVVLAALFSAVITTCVVQTSLDLDPDYAQITAHLMAEQIQLLRMAGNATGIAAVPSSSFGPESVTHTQLDVWINGLFYICLSLSLAAALVSSLAKQWITSYASIPSGDAKKRSLHRQFHFNGLQKWKLKETIQFMPIILHLSLAIFLVGFALFVYRRNSWLSSIVFILTGFTILFYTITTILPAIHLDCPYQNPALSHPTHIVVYLAAKLNHLGRCYYCKLYEKLHGILPSKLYKKLYLPHLPPPQQLAGRFSHIEEIIIRRQPALDVDSVFWLFGETTNPSIQSIVIEMVISDALLLRGILFGPRLKNILPLIVFAIDRLFSSPAPDDEEQLSKFLLQILAFLPSIRDGVSRPYRQLIGSDNIDSWSPSGRPRMLVLAVEYGQEDIVRFLLRKGANPNNTNNESLAGSMSPLWLDIVKKNITIAKLLLQARSNPNQIYEAGMGEMAEHPLHTTCSEGDLAMMELLLSHGANPYLTDVVGRTPLHCACQDYNVAAVNILILVDDPFEVKSPEGHNIESPNALHFMCTGGERTADNNTKFNTIADLLLSKGLDINGRDSEGMTPLHWATTHGYSHAIKYIEYISYEPWNWVTVEYSDQRSRSRN